MGQNVSLFAERQNSKKGLSEIKVTKIDSILSTLSIFHNFSEHSIFVDLQVE